jgi:hypothetical protein
LQRRQRAISMVVTTAMIGKKKKKIPCSMVTWPRGRRGAHVSSSLLRVIALLPLLLAVSAQPNAHPPTPLPHTELPAIALANIGEDG